MPATPPSAAPAPPLLVVGLDEAGVGPAFGSLWAAAAALRPGAAWPAGLRDSKRLTPRARARLAPLLRACAHHGLGEVTAAEIDAGGLGEARRLVFERALDDLARREGGALDPAGLDLVVDGTLFRPWRGARFACVPKADATVPEAMAASVLAKTARDAQVAAQCDADPTLDARYDLRRNKGYLAPKHLAGLRRHGPSALHRTSYRLPARDDPAPPADA